MGRPQDIPGKKEGLFFTTGFKSSINKGRSVLTAEANKKQ
jgi:hypothetical protein